MPKWKKLPRLGLQGRITALTVIGLSAIFTTTGLISERALAASVQVALDQRVALAEMVAAHVHRHVILPLLAELAEAAAWPGFDLTDGDPRPEEEALAALYRRGSFSYDVFVADAGGRVLAVEPQALRAGLMGADFSKHTHIRQALATGQPQVSGAITGVIPAGSLVSLVAPVRNGQGTVVGLIGGTLDSGARGVAGFIEPLALGATGYAQVVDSQGVVIASTRQSGVGLPSEHLELLLSLMQRGEPAVSPDSDVVENGKAIHEIIAFAPIPELGWGVTVEQDRTEALAPIARLQTETAAFAIVALLGAALLVFLTTRQVTRPVVAIAGAARRVAEDNFDAPLPVFGSDEVGQLGRDFETMRSRLRESQELHRRWDAEMERQVAERTRQLVGLQQATRRLTADLSLEATLGAMVEESRRLFGADRCAVFVRDPDGHAVTCLIQRGLSAEYVERVCRNYDRMPGGLAAATAQPVVVADAPADPRMAAVADQVRREGFHSLLILPFVHHGQVIGAFALYHDQPRGYSPEEVSLGEAFAAQAASAVTNARLYQTVQHELAERQRAEAEVRQRIEELERFNRLAVGRELKMKELKERIRELERGPAGK